MCQQHHISPRPRPPLCVHTASTPYAGFPANWRAPLPDDNTPADAQPQGTVGEDEEDEEEEEDTGSAQTLPGGEDPVNSLRTTSVVLEEAKRVSRSSAAESTRRPMRTAQRPPGIESLQTESQRRRALPLSKLKRVKPKRRRFVLVRGEVYQYQYSINSGAVKEVASTVRPHLLVPRAGPVTGRDQLLSFALYVVIGTMSYHRRM